MSQTQMKELSLLKERENFLFRYESGHEEVLLDPFVEMANDRDNKFAWLDAPVLSFQLSKQLVEEADQLLCPRGHSVQTGSVFPEADVYTDPE